MSKIDELYDNNYSKDNIKDNFYLGMISQVYVSNSYMQVENMSLLKPRLFKNNFLNPNTINYFVVINSANGIFIGKIYQSKILGNSSILSYNKNSNEIIPELKIDILGLLSNNSFILPGEMNVGIADKVYIANKKSILIYLKSIEINSYNQKKLNGFANLYGHKNIDCPLYPNSIFDKHLIVIGKTNSGKSTSSLSIIDKMLNSKKKMLIIDPTGEYVDSFDNTEIKKVTLGIDSFINVNKVSIKQWEILFQANEVTQGIAISEAIKSLTWANKNNDSQLVKNGNLIKNDNDYSYIERLLSSVEDDNDFDISNLASQIDQEAVSINRQNIYKYDSFKKKIYYYIKSKIKYAINNTKINNIFKNNFLENENLINQIQNFLNTQETSLYINTSNLGLNSESGTMIIDLISRYINSYCFQHKKNTFPFVMFIDEAHKYTRNIENPNNLELVNIAREGRKNGIFLFLTTQSPKDLPKLLLSQVGTLLIHRMTDYEEINTIKNNLEEEYISYLKKLNSGEAILTSANLIKNIILKFKKSSRIHHNSTPLL